jgi:hypothetical protein
VGEKARSSQPSHELSKCVPRTECAAHASILNGRVTGTAWRQ